MVDVQFMDNNEALDPGLLEAIRSAGSKRKLAQLLSLTPQAISYWRQVPLERLIQVEAATGVSRRKLRPDVFDEAAA